MLAEREALVLSLLQTARRPKPLEAERPERRAALEHAHRALSGPARERFDAALSYAERVYGLRDDNVLYTEGFPNGLLAS